MPSTNKTTNLSLNQWAENDRPMRNDFNSDNAKLDAVVGSHINNGNIHVTAEEKEYLRDSHMVYMYTGTGESSKTITLTEKFRYFSVFANNKPFADGNKMYSAIGYVGLGSTLGLSLSASGTGFTVSQNDTACLNETGVQYKVIMFK
ncbi:MAG: hypothetical protein IKK10_00895 [Clostridia bacterium]|nr:hypothetical protein [Clostridia bacterium]